MTGCYRDIEKSHPYLRSGNFENLKNNIYKIRLINDSVGRFIKNIPDGTVDKFNLSDIFEYMSFPDYLRTIDNLIQICGSNARISFWTLFVPRRIPLMYGNSIEAQNDLSENLSTKVKTFFYGDFNVWKIYPRFGLRDTGFAIRDKNAGVQHFEYNERTR
jgi:S-adenosylmethionine-diacylglycerol 3-amino-3-carboxypropyl transferase